MRSRSFARRRETYWDRLYATMPRPKPRRSSDPFRRRRDTVMARLGFRQDDAASFLLPSRALPFFAPLPLLLAFLAYRLHRSAQVGAGTIALVLGGTLLAALLSLVPSDLTVGRDGIHLIWIGRARFVPAADIAAIEPYDFWFDSCPGVRIQLRSGESIHLCTSLGILFWRDRWSERDGIITLIQNEREALASIPHKSRGRAPDAIARGSLSHVEWIRALRTLGEGANATLRVAPVPEERLLAVVEDASASPADRAAAAIAVGRGRDVETKRRITAAAEATGHPALKQALRIAVSGGDDEALAEALAEAEAGDESARRTA